MYNDDICDKVRKLLSRNKIKYRSIDLDDDRMTIGIELNKSEGAYIMKKLKSLNLTPINITYGRWLFKVHSL